MRRNGEDHSEVDASVCRSSGEAESMATKFSLKLLINSRTNTVLFAEAGKEVVDFIFGLLAMPVGSIVKLLSKERMVGSFGSIYGSVESMDRSYMESDLNKSLLLNPTVASPLKTTSLFLIEGSTGTAAKKIYRCSSTPYSGCSSYYADVYGTCCPQCQRQMTAEMHYATPKSGTADVAADVGDSTVGFVKGVVTYSIMDDLTVMPMSTISSITMLNKFNVQDISLLEERTVSLGLEEGLEVLRVSLRSETVLTDVFLGKQKGSMG